MLSEGQSLVVQVVKDPMGTKGARLSTQVSIAGRMLVHLPQEKHIGVSQRIEAEAEREALRERLGRLVPEDEQGGFIVRTMAENACDDEFATDIAYLRKIWADIRDKARISAPPTVLYQELSLGQRVLRDFVNPETVRIVGRLARELRAHVGLRRRIHAGGAAAARALHRRTAAVRPARRRG